MHHSWTCHFRPSNHQLGYCICLPMKLYSSEKIGINEKSQLSHLEPTRWFFVHFPANLPINILNGAEWEKMQIPIGPFVLLGLQNPGNLHHSPTTQCTRNSKDLLNHFKWILYIFSHPQPLFIFSFFVFYCFFYITIFLSDSMKLLPFILFLVCNFWCEGNWCIQ